MKESTDILTWPDANTFCRATGQQSAAMETTMKYCTTRPTVPPYSQQPVIHTSNPKVTLRPYKADDLADVHELRSQIDVMQWTSKGTVDEDLDATKAWMGRWMHVGPHIESFEEQEEIEAGGPLASVEAKFNFALVYTSDSEHDAASKSHGAVIGCLGVHAMEPELECGYMIRKEFWGQGIATIAMKAFLEAWWKLPRKSIEITPEQAQRAVAYGAHISTNEAKGVENINEILIAVTAEHNIGSRKVLSKCGFQFQSSRTISERGKEVTLADHSLNRPSVTG